MTVQGADDVSTDIWLCVCGRAEPISGAVAAVRACLLRVHVCCCDTFALLFPHNTQRGVFVKTVNGDNSDVANGKHNDDALYRASSLALCAITQ